MPAERSESAGSGRSEASPSTQSGDENRTSQTQDRESNADIAQRESAEGNQQGAGRGGQREASDSESTDSREHSEEVARQSAVEDLSPDADAVPTLSFAAATRAEIMRSRAGDADSTLPGLAAFAGEVMQLASASTAKSIADTGPAIDAESLLGAGVSASLQTPAVGHLRPGMVEAGATLGADPATAVSIAALPAALSASGTRLPAAVVPVLAEGSDESLGAIVARDSLFSAAGLNRDGSALANALSGVSGAGTSVATQAQPGSLESSADALDMSDWVTTKSGATLATTANASQAMVDSAPRPTTTLSIEPPPTGVPSVVPGATPVAAPATSALQNSAIPELSLTRAPQDPEFAGELTARMKTLVSDGVREARLQLHPAELGRLQVTITTEGDQARIAFLADSTAAKDAIELSMPRLRDMLEQNGLELAHTDVGQRDSMADSENADSDGADDGVPGLGDDDAQSDEAALQQSAMLARLSSGRIDTYI
ncbi:MAG: flagellar hook-length control protein FliK [Congregibacter sp.]